MRDRSATRALVLGLLSLPFGVFAPFAIWSAARSLRRVHSSEGALKGTSMAVAGLVAGMLGLGTLLAGTVYWFLAS
jgi:hypothetical protein